MDPEPPRALHVPRRLLDAVWADPRHLPERLVLYAVARQAGPSHAWAQAARRSEPDAQADDLAERTAHEVAVIGRVDGAISGTPFLLALVPAYCAVLWEQAAMVMRIAALNGRDPRTPGMAEEILVLRGVYGSEGQAADALRGLHEPAPGRGWRPLRTMWDLGLRIAVLGGFVSPREPGTPKPPRLKTAAKIVLGASVYVLTWIFPLSFMLLMSWSCETDSRKTAQRARTRYGDPDEELESWSRSSAGAGIPGWRRTLHRVALGVSLAIPVLFIAFAVKARPLGKDWIAIAATAVGLITVLSIALAAARGRRRLVGMEGTDPAPVTPPAGAPPAPPAR